MEKRELRRLFDAVFDGIKNTGLSYVNKEIKYVHFNPDCRLSKAEKIEISNTLNGARRKNQTIQKIISARQELENQGRKVTQKRIAEIAKLSPKTVRAHLNSELIDIDELVQMINDSVPLKNLAASMNNTCQISQ
jgi:Fic family protein